MKIDTTLRSFETIEFPVYVQNTRLVAQSSAIGPYKDAMDKPGSSYLWFGDNHHLSREDVTALVVHLENWLRTGKLNGNGDNNG